MTGPSDYGGSFYAANMAPAPARGRLTAELDVDVCVIGGGLAGLTAAREIARRGWSVVVLEARRIAWNASGRNTGFVLPGFAADADTIIQRVGRDHAKTLWALSEAGAEYVRSTIRETEMPGIDLSENGWLHVSKQDDDRRRADYADLLEREFGAAVEFWPTERVRASLDSERHFSAVQYKRGFSINPLNYALGLAAAAEAAGARIFEETPALQIDPAGVRKRVSTPSARVRAAHVVFAGNVHLGGLMPQLSRTLVAVSTYVLVTAPLGDELRETIRYHGAVSDTDLADNHYRVVAGNRLMWSGRATVWTGNPRRRVKPLLADLARTYPQLAGAKAEYAWTGVLGNTVHRMPQIGEISPGVWVLSGFGGHGLNTTAMGGDIVARGIVESAQTWRLFTPFDLVWAGWALGRAFVQGWYACYRARERIVSWRSRQREWERLRAAGPKQPGPAPEPLAPSVVPEEPEAVAAPPAKRRKRKRRKGRKQDAAPIEAAAPANATPSGEPAAPAAADKQSADGGS